MAEGIENTQEQKVILKKAKPDSVSAATAQPQVQQTVEQKPVRTIKRKLKPVAHPTAQRKLVLSVSRNGALLYLQLLRILPLR